MKILIRILTLLSVVLFASPLSAQTATEAWNVRINGPANQQDYGNGVAMDASGNVIIVGGVNYPGQVGSGLDVYTAKYDANGGFIWDRHRNGPNNTGDLGSAATVDAAGNVITIGSLFSNGYTDYYTVKYSPTGTLLWEKSYNGPGNSYDNANAVAVDAAGNVIVTGASVNTAGNYDIYTVKYAASNGAVLWEKRQTSVDRNYYAAAVAVDAAGNVVIAGGSENTNFDNQDSGGVYVAKYAGATGALIWDTPLMDDVRSGIANDLVLDSSGNVIVTGYGFAGTGLGGGAFSGAHYTFYTVKLGTADGIPIWETFQSGTSSETAFISGTAVGLDSSGNVAVTGTILNNGTGQDYYTAKYASEDGSLLWEKIYNGPGNGEDVAAALAVDSSGNVVVTGRSVGPSFSADFYTAKLSSLNGTLIWEARYNGPGNAYDTIEGSSKHLVLTSDGGAIVSGTSGDAFNTQEDIVTIRYTPPPPDTITQPPVLVAPAENAFTNSPITVTYNLPETALPGSVQIKFHDFITPTEVLLTVDAAGETVGPHTYIIDAANPGASPGVITATGGPILDGKYTVLVSYQDQFHNARAFDFHFNVTVDTVTLPPVLNLPAASTTVGNPITVDFSLPETAKPGSVKLSFGATVLTLASSQESPGPHTFSLDPANPTASPQIVSGGAIPDGTYTVTLSYQDAPGNPAASDTSADVTVNTATEPPSAPVFTSLYSKGGAVPGAGTDARIQAGALWTGFGPPAINDAGQIAYIGRWSAPATAGPPPLKKQSGAGIFVGDTLVAKVGEAVPGLAGATFKVLKDPVIDRGGHVAFLATITGTGVVTPSDDTMVVSNGAGTLAVLAREGSSAPGANGAIFKGFTSVSIQGDTIGGTIFTATLLQGSGSPAATSASDTGAWWQPAGSATVLKLVREGDPAFVGAETIKSFLVLNALGGSPAHGRGQIAGDEALMQIVSNTGRQSQVLAQPNLLSEYAATGDTLDGSVLPAAKWSKMGLPSSGSAGANVSTLGLLATGIGGVSKADARGIFQSTDAGATWEPVVRTGQIAPGFGGGAIFSALKDPVNSPTCADVAFIGAAAGGTVTPTTNDGLWWQADGAPLALVAREGDEPACGPVGAKWKSFTSLALPGGDVGPVFTANLQKGIGIAPGPGGVTSLNDFGLYALDGAGAVRELVREGQSLLGKTVKTFNVLKAVSGSAGVTRSFNNAGSIVVLVTFTDDTTAIVRIDLPTDH
jgi:hypothetical protein